MLIKMLKLHPKTEGLLSPINNICQRFGMGNRYHANCLFVTSELEAVTGSAISLDVTFVICELFLQSLLAAQVGLLSSVIFKYSS